MSITTLNINENYPWKNIFVFMCIVIVIFVGCLNNSDENEGRYSISVTSDIENPLVATINDTIEISVEAFVDESNDSEVFEYAWDCENSAFHIQSENTQNLSIITPNNIDSTSCVIKVEHKNSVALDTFHIHIVQDRPSANAGNDTTIYRGEELMISGKNSIDSIGRIVEYQWDFSLEEVDYSILTNRVDTTIIFPNEMIEDIQFVLTVIDDDGQLDSDSLFVSTRLYTGIGVPIISATDSVDISINDEIEIELSVLGVCRKTKAPCV